MLSHKDRLSQFIKKTTVDLNFWEGDEGRLNSLHRPRTLDFWHLPTGFLIIRQEYYNFMTDVIAEVENGQVKGGTSSPASLVSASSHFISA